MNWGRESSAKELRPGSGSRVGVGGGTGRSARPTGPKPLVSSEGARNNAN